MINTSLVNFDLLIRYVGVIFITFTVLILIYLIVNKVKEKYDNLKDKFILEIILQVLKISVCIAYFILTLFATYIYFKYDFSLQLANYCNSIMETHLNFKGTYKITYIMKTKDGLSEPIEYIQDILGTIVKIILNYYRTASILVIASFPLAFKGFIGVILGIIVIKCSTFFLNLFGTKNQYFEADGYIFEKLFNLYNVSINLMLITVFLIPLIYILSKYVNKNYLCNDKNSVNFVELPNKKFSFLYAKQVAINLKICLTYFKFDILLIVLKTLTIFGIFVYFNSLLFILLHNVPINLVKLLKQLLTTYL